MHTLRMEHRFATFSQRCRLTGADKRTNGCPGRSRLLWQLWPPATIRHYPTHPPLSCLWQFCQNFERGRFHNRKCVQDWRSSARHDLHPPQLMRTAGRDSSPSSAGANGPAAACTNAQRVVRFGEEREG
ncbi:unnamed protein product [Rangifer tarandus platyrhynchus]|uniref:Uncharacterized protein n=1 Tax=Rangifer tarandus platyrhynchus TaxID=3082113 RepID=A0AC59YFN8_RANTA